MKIKLDADHYITGDDSQVTLVRTFTVASGKTAGEIKSTPVGYYPDVPQALESFATRKARTSDASTIREYIETLKTIRGEIRELCREAQ